MNNTWHFARLRHDHIFGYMGVYIIPVTTRNIKYFTRGIQIHIVFIPIFCQMMRNNGLINKG